MKKKKTWAVLLLLLLIGVAAWAYWTSGVDPQVAKVQEMRAAIDAAPRDQRRAMYGQFREELDKLSPEARQAMFADRWKERQQEMKKQMGEFFALPYAQQIAKIDKDIDDRERRRQQWAQRQGQNGSQQARGPGGGGFGGGFAGTGGGGPGGPGRNRSSDPLQRMKDRLDNSDPLERAQRSAYRQMQQQRRQQRGLN